MEDIMEKAEELGKAMTETDEFQKVQDAQARLNEDIEAQALLEGLQQAQDKVQRLQMSGLQPTEDQMKEVNEKRQQMSSNAAVSAFMQAQSEFGEVVRKVNEAISEGMKKEAENEE